ncbi:MAG: hypothetical protein H3C47_14020 [Candidatus Cloacimonetes bacterium]|nr:hypothetical protein [Candidatus Cloacimonadota bacterium]
MLPRAYLVLLFILLALGLCLEVLQRENLQMAMVKAFEDKDHQGAIKIARHYLKRDESVYSAHQILAQSIMQLHLSEPQTYSLTEARTHIKRAIEINPHSPEVHRVFAQLYALESRLYQSEDGYSGYIQSMKNACAADPNNYFYYSVFFEELVEWGSNMQFLKSRFSEDIWLSAIGFALKNYLRLKDWYKEDYLQLVDVLFSGRQKQKIFAESL